MAGGYVFSNIKSVAPALVAAYDLHDDPGDHKGEQEENDVYDYIQLHMGYIWHFGFIDLTDGAGQCKGMHPSKNCILGDETFRYFETGYWI